MKECPGLSDQIFVVNKQELFMNSGKFDVTICKDDGRTTRIYCRNRANNYGWAIKLEERQAIRDAIVLALKEREREGL